MTIHRLLYKCMGVQQITEASQADDLISPAFADLFPDMLSGQDNPHEIRVQKREGTFYLRVRGIPTVFEDGLHGMTILMEDVTRERQYVRDLEFLARTSKDFADMDDGEHIFQYMADGIAELVPGGVIGVTSINPEATVSTLEGVSGDPQLLEGLFQGLGINADRISFPTDPVPIAIPSLSTGVLSEAGVDLYDQMFRMFPKDLCDQVQERLSLGKNYCMGCVCRGGLYGCVVILLKKGVELPNRETIEAFVRQAGVALQRKRLRERLKEPGKQWASRRSAGMDGRAQDPDAICPGGMPAGGNPTIPPL